MRWIALSLLVATPAFAHHTNEDQVLVKLAKRPAATGPVVAYLNPEGATLESGDDDSAGNVSILAQHAGERVRVPAYRGTHWGEVVDCVRGLYSPFQIQITDERPAASGYIMIVVGGSSSLLGYPSNVAGVSPMIGRVNPGAVGYVFDRTIGDRPREVCEAVAHELGHTLGLDHEVDCHDIMSYGQCGAKTFVDQDFACGEDEGDDRACDFGGPTQNSFEQLASALGVKNEAPAPPAAEDPPPEEEPPATDDDGGEGGPSVDIQKILVRHGRRSSEVSIAIHASSDSGIKRLVLEWEKDGRRQEFDCANIPDGKPVTCTAEEGDRYVFTLKVGSGERSFAVHAFDADGAEAEIDVPHVTFRD